MKKVKKIGGYIICNAIFYLLVWMAVFNGSAGARRFVAFGVWVLAVSAFFCFRDADLVKGLRKKGRTVPAYFENTKDMVVILFLVWHGWWMTAIGLCIANTYINIIYKGDKKSSEEQKENEDESTVQ